MSTTKRRDSAGWPATVVAALCCVASGQAVASNDDLFDMSLEELVNLSVTSVSRKSEPLANATSAVFVITREDMQRQGIRSIPDALRLVPGLSVLQIDANKWAIGSRGQTGRFANKLLVLMDGRILYTPTFSGVFWDVQSTLIEEIERIEVIRGPGAAVWGSNAVNGVINIISRSPDGRSSGAVIAGTDPESAPFAAVQVGGPWADQGGWRAFARYQEGTANMLESGRSGDDDWNLFRAGYRAALDNGEDSFAFNTEAYVGAMGQSFVQYDPQPPYLTVSAVDTDVSGGFLTGEWTRRHASGASTQMQMVVDVTDRDGPFAIGQTSVSLDAHHQWTDRAQEWIVGAQIRRNEYDIEPTSNYALLEDIGDDRVIAAFVHNEITLWPDKLSVTLGTKLEHNSLSPKSVEVMPTARALWKPDPSTSVWAGAARAVRTPSVGDLGAIVVDAQPAIPPGDPVNPFPVPLRSSVFGNPQFGPETMYAYEAGVRGRISENVSFDVAAFVFDYDDLRSAEAAGARCAPSGTSLLVDPSCVLTAQSVVAEAVLANGIESRISGGELSMDWVINDATRVSGFIAYASEDADNAPIDGSGAAGYPEWQGMVRMEWSPVDGLSVAALLRYVDDIDVSAVRSYTQGNVNVRWQFHADWVLSAGVRNLLDDATLEYRSELFDVLSTEIERAAYLNLHYDF